MGRCPLVTHTGILFRICHYANDKRCVDFNLRRRSGDKTRGIGKDRKEGVGKAGPSRATAGPGKPLPRGPITTHRRRKGGVSGAVVHFPPSQKIGKIFFGQLSCKIRAFSGKYHKYHKYHPTKGLGERRKLPSGVRGRAPAENGFYAYFRSERSHLEHPFQYF